jgi:hypothetical protein
VRRAVSGLFATIVPATPSATNPPAAAATPAVTDEETVILRAECGDLQRQVKELKETVAALQAQLATAQREAIVVLDQDDIAKAHNRAQIAESALTQARRDLDNALACERELEREIRLNNDGFHRLHEDWIALGIETAQLRDSLAGMQERVTVVLQEKGAATKEVKRLRNQLDAHAQKALDAVPLDAFSNTLDQISEAQVLSSVEGLNEAISDFLSNLTLEAAQRVDAPAENESHELEFCEDEKRLWEALQTPCLDDEYRDLLLEAFLRTIILRAIHSLFFANVVLSFCVDEAQLMDNLYDKIRASGKLIAIDAFGIYLMPRRVMDGGAEMESVHGSIIRAHSRRVFVELAGVGSLRAHRAHRSTCLPHANGGRDVPTRVGARSTAGHILSSAHSLASNQARHHFREHARRAVREVALQVR